ncbi:MAG: hypothetical protein IJO71_02695 [Microbacterium sp.]|uniref:hypothetical protein n=1 Tax=Microbacterium sp. TaxID=51671 RepID=UPI0025CF7689|nr:hypothetical protein [Microbacterium sp.]MBQ9916091.1 hypothetical protein [Microbacterium sp.]
MTVAGWLGWAALNGVVAVVAAVALVVIGLVGARRQVSAGWLVVSGRAVFGVLLVAVVLGLVAVLITGVVGAFASFG